MVSGIAEKSKKDSLYTPFISTITDIKELTQTERQFTIRIDDEEKRKKFDFLPGQFVEITVFGVGEAPFSIPSSPNNKDSIELCIRKIGSVSGALHGMPVGSKVGIRGPFGKGYFPYEKMMNNNVVIIAGGLGIDPVGLVLRFI